MRLMLSKGLESIMQMQMAVQSVVQKHIGGNSKSPRRNKGGWLFIIITYYAKKNFSHNIYYDIIAAPSCILFVWVVGWGMRFRTPPKCADAVYCVRALGGGRKRRGGMAVCLKRSDSKLRKPLGDK